MLRKGAGVKVSLRELTERALLESGPVGALVNDRGELLYLHGHTGRYLEPAPGEAGVNILKMAREGLRHDLTTALYKAAGEKTQVIRRGVRLKTNGDFSFVDVTVRPVAGNTQGAESQLFLVIFDPSKAPEMQDPARLVPADGHRGAGAEPLDANGPHVRALEEELRAKDEYLQAAQEEMQTANEELRSSNEELQSTNEELQSTNEELETSKEELQSVNEELSTVNAELQGKVVDLSRVNNDMNNLLAGTGIGTVFVDQQARIQRFTPAVTQFINLIQTDIGRPLGHIVSNFVGYDRLVADVQQVLDTLTDREVEVQSRSGAWYLLRIKPYRTSENVIEGAVVTFTEVTTLKNAQAVMREWDSIRTLAGAVHDAADAITVQDLHGRILAWNPGAARMYGWSETDALAMNVRDLVPEGRREEELAVVRRLSRAEVLEPYRSQRLAKNGRIMDVTLTATALVNERGEVYALSTTERGIVS